LELPGGATWEWVEAYGLLRADPAAVHGTWDEARDAVTAALERLVPRASLDAALASAAHFGSSAPGPEPLHHGSGWGALEVAAGALPGDALRPFGSCDAEQQPWLDLLTTQRLPPSDPPASPVTGPKWRALLETSADDWHTLYHLGLLRLADADRTGAHDAWTRSLANHPNAWAQRALAHLAETPDEVADLMVAAHRLQPTLRELTIETLKALLTANRAAEALVLISTLPPEDQTHGRLRLYTAQAALAIGDIARVRQLLDDGITVDNLQEGEDSLDLLWLAAHPDLPVPPEYDFRMSGS
jgi:hypothetical protein